MLVAVADVLAIGQRAEAAVLKAGELGIGVGDRGETPPRVRLQLFFHRRKRKRVVFLILLGGAGRAALGLILLILVGRGGGLLLFVLVLLEAGTGGLGADLAVAVSHICTWGVPLR